MKLTLAKSPNAQKAYTIVQNLQHRFAIKLSALSEILGENRPFEEVTWLRDEGVHGGGSRFEARDSSLFNTGSINVSQVHYDDMPEKNLQSATAISTIIHPKNPLVPSMHMHISLTELRDGSAYWRLMADLNPSNFNEDDKNIFDVAIANVAEDLYEEGALQGDKYFYIPALKRHRGVSHFYLENYKSENREEDEAFALAFGEAVIDIYVDIIANAIKTREHLTKEELQNQLNYHTLYLFQVLTLDRGTTSGLLIHNQNDTGIMGSLPTHIDRELLLSWKEKLPAPQNMLVEKLASAIDDDGAITVDVKKRLASLVREHYKEYPEALSMQASGDTLPTTVANHIKV